MERIIEGLNGKNTTRLASRRSHVRNHRFAMMESAARSAIPDRRRQSITSDKAASSLLARRSTHGEPEN
jgi:hypothetical protein